MNQDCRKSSEFYVTDSEQICTRSYKRSMELSSSELEEDVSLCKYRKVIMTTEQKILEEMKNRNLDTTSISSDKLVTESSESKEMSQENSASGASAIDYSFENKDSVDIKVQLEMDNKKDLGDAVNVQMQTDLRIEMIQLVENQHESDEVLQNNLYENSGLIASDDNKDINHSSEFSLNNNLDQNNTDTSGNKSESSNEGDIEQDETEIDKTEITDTIIDINESSATTNQILCKLDVTSQDNSTENDNDERDNSIPNSYQLNLNKSAGEIDLCNLKKSNSFSVESQSTSRAMSTENIEQICNDQNIPTQTYISSQMHQLPNTSGTIGGQQLVGNANDSDITVGQLLVSLKQDIQELTKVVQRQENILEAVVHVHEINLSPLFAQSFPEKYNLKLPFTRIEDFDTFNQDLQKNMKFCNEFITSLCSFIDNKVTLSKNILTMLRTYMSKDLAKLYTASKPTPNKLVLKDTLFCKCLLQATKMSIRNGLLPLEHEKAFMKSLGLVVSGAKGWHNDDKTDINCSQ